MPSIFERAVPATFYFREGGANYIQVGGANYPQMVGTICQWVELAVGGASCQWAELAVS